MARTEVTGSQIKDASVSLTADVTGTLPVGNGGTGAVTLTGIVKGNGTSAFTTMTAPSGTVVGDTDVQTLTNKRITPRVTALSNPGATPTINTDNCDAVVITGQTSNITSMTTNLSGTPTSEQKLTIAITGTAARTITWGASYENGPVTLPTTTVTTQRLDVGLVWNAATSKFRCMAVGSG